MAAAAAALDRDAAQTEPPRLASRESAGHAGVGGGAAPPLPERARVAASPRPTLGDRSRTRLARVPLPTRGPRPAVRHYPEGRDAGVTPPPSPCRPRARRARHAWYRKDRPGADDLTRSSGGVDVKLFKHDWPMAGRSSPSPTDASEKMDVLLDPL